MTGGLSAWVIPTLTACIGGLVVHWVSKGRDRRKERNEARYPIWRWFKGTPPGNGTQLEEFERHHEQDLHKYEYQAPKSEWRKFKKHYDAIDELRKKVRTGHLDIADFSEIPAVELTQPELDKVFKHWQKIIKLTRHRK
ncbi:hypothetical protein [Halomonas sp. KHS3]|uniref:hypothetical protein n=1 Tax=Halomonas sp. KHS3 TaxID=866350 RepID=UPI00059AC53D|nr:hypothetical protein [Halomonas sp. KHS3]KIN13503.1 hypothetical protein RO22_19770 [Halomonas sp. KHS3]